MFDPYLTRWRLAPDGEEIRTNYGRLLPVRRDGTALMLKIALDVDEARGGELLAWWEGQGAARVFELDGRALLMERLTGPGSLAEMARSGRDDEATRVLCDVAAGLHAPREQPRPDLTSLETWFRALWPAADERGGRLAASAEIARALLDTERDRVVLHGDLHHGNVLDGGERGWLAIDPKRLYGERAFDFVNILRNPDIATSLVPGRFARQVDVIVDAAGLDRERFLQWIAAFTALSAAWLYEDGVEPESDLAINALAFEALRRV